MQNLLSKRIWALVVTVCLVSLPLMQPVNATVISTKTAMELAERQDRIDRISDVLARGSVEQALIGLGVEPADAIGRVDALTDAELLTLEQQLDELPAGGTGVVEVVGIVAIVLIVLELLHVTNFFSEF